MAPTPAFLPSEPLPLGNYNGALSKPIISLVDRAMDRDRVGRFQSARAMREALIRSVAVRTRPILLTAGTTLLGNWVITLDPIFSGLAWAIIFGILTSTGYTQLVIPVVYWLLYGRTGQAPS